MDHALPTLADVKAAADRIAPLAVRTPLLSSPDLDERAGGRILLKAETFQRTGTFKFRGACNFIRLIPAERRPAGVVAWSSGNHAQGVAAAAALHGVEATIVMPDDAPAPKRAGTERYGATVIGYDRTTESREEIGRAIAAETGATVVPPFDHPWTIAGQGTVGLEMAEQTAAAGHVLDAVLVPCSGGGLVSGVAIGLSGSHAQAEVYAVEPADCDDTARSLAAGERVANPPDADSICDALLVPIPGEVTFEIMRSRLAGALTVSDAETLRAMRYAFETLKVVLEPGGAVALATVLAGRFAAAGRTVGVVLSGGNVDPGTFARAIG
jgi:threonine dehydratase